MTKGLRTDLFDLSEPLWIFDFLLEQIYSEEDLKRLFVDTLIPSTEPNVRRYLVDSPLFEMNSLVNYDP